VKLFLEFFFSPFESFPFYGQRIGPGQYGGRCNRDPSIWQRVQIYQYHMPQRFPKLFLTPYLNNKYTLGGEGLGRLLLNQDTIGQSSIGLAVFEEAETEIR